MIDSYLNDRAFIAVKRDAKFKTRCEKDVLFVNRQGHPTGNFEKKT